MFLIDIIVFIDQILPPNWRVDGRVDFLKAILTPFKTLYNDFVAYRTEARNKVNLTAQVIVIESYLSLVTGEQYGIYVRDEVLAGKFSVSIPIAANSKNDQVVEFLESVTPLGRSYQIYYY